MDYGLSVRVTMVERPGSAYQYDCTFSFIARMPKIGKLKIVHPRRRRRDSFNHCWLAGAYGPNYVN